MEIPTKEVEVYRNQVSDLEIKANELSITSPEENAIAIEFKAKIDKTGKDIKAKKESITKPINASLRMIRELFAPLESMFENADTIVGNKLLAYKRKVEEETRKKEAQLAARVEKGTMKIETVERKIAELPKIQKTTHTSAGQVQFRKVPMMRIIDEKLIPDKYWVIDMVALRKDVVGGEIVAGAERYYEERV
jgi:hypothetical protein